MPYIPIRQLADLVLDRGDNEIFAHDYAGDYVPPQLPHSANWPTANNHWQDYNNGALNIKKVHDEPTHARRVALAESYSRYVLWALVHLGNCPRCLGSAVVDDEKLNEILTEAQNV